MKIKESLNVTFEESPPPTKLSPLVDDDVGEEEAIETKVKVDNNVENESIEVDEEVMSMREYVGPNDDHTREEESAYSMSSSVSDIRDDDITTVHVSRIFDHFRCMCLNIRRSDRVNTSGNPHRLVPYENETTCVGNADSQPRQTYVRARAESFRNAAPVNNNVSTSDVSRVECLHSISTVTHIDCCVSMPSADSPLVTPTPEHVSGLVATQTQGDVNDAMGSKKKTVVVTSDPLLKWIWRTTAAAVVEMVVTWCGGSEVVLAVVMMPVGLSRCRGDDGGVVTMELRWGCGNSGDDGGYGDEEMAGDGGGWQRWLLWMAAAAMVEESGGA
nr:hypothetical protein CTI12_AA182560 [Tanacetum cinerariifolium]